MSDSITSLAIESISTSNSVKVSKDLNDNSAGNPMFMELSDGIDSLDLVVVDSPYGATPTALPIGGKFESIPTTYTDGDATPFLTSAKGKLQSIVSANDIANSETNPIFTQDVSSVLSSIEVLDYDTAASVLPGATSTHDYTVTAAKTFKVNRCFGSSSASEKIELQAGPISSLVTQGVQFTSQAALNWEMKFDGLLEVPDTSTGTVRIIRTNRETKPPAGLDVYSTIVGTEV